MTIRTNRQQNRWLTELRERLASFSDDALFQFAEKYIWLSAYANNNPHSDFHPMADESYRECKRRDKLDLYDRAWRRAAGKD